MKKNLTFTTQVFREGKQYVSFNPELEVASCGKTPQEAKEKLREAIAGFITVALKRGTLDSILEQAGFVKKKNSWHDPEPISLDRLTISV
ncbi:MAG: hypothetical protein A3C70_02250 [Candidatus Zambryskibacteria bacterium RIFCSPHIGHO2_02_FULL_43_14]|uniref:HicB-like antitoxin of toxin-antitoxin system domain-containing protein n=1 Tax=Candidatus Zambryskibacteria bacterium RIFCSPHIGHO2_02_FULL_43_14 TaxID=1802748 RepID=A0A1G2TEM9_9BACT|nr:MAG: hypothetical protein A2829_02285 [Candidatus Zambryskibacteria bacterium RIFCSPHIGHO2_01_FULL_43_60]OHA95632.1 MAG: hypothetical protein A3C70_02250 [Candidatus Zambryskibacteria bacterium RIFCSPHIGHO2_02_FULL_43_14]OHB03324.1 MAG: hypothetical protein A3B03_03085 [Candidatus Zambryskibacteria bacterium RIFCSPLOWO2_01_FULL_42_41]